MAIDLLLKLKNKILEYTLDSENIEKPALPEDICVSNIPQYDI